MAIGCSRSRSETVKPRQHGFIKKFVVSYPKWAGTPRYFGQLPLLPAIKHGVRRRNRTAQTSPRRRVAKNSR